MKIRITQWVFLGLLLLIFFHPVFHFKKRVPPYGILLIDESESMKDTKRLKADLPFTLKNYYFGKNEEGTNIGKALKEAAKKYPEASLIILFSDGANTKGENPIKVASGLNMPIYFILPKSNKITTHFISVYGPSSAIEEDSIKINVYYKVPETGTVEIKFNDKVSKKDIKEEGIFDFSFLPSKGKNNIQLNLLIENDIIDKTEYSVDVKEKQRLLIINEIPNWNYKFIKRYFEDNNWKVTNWKKDNIKVQDLQNYNMLCVLDNPEKYKEEIEKYLLKGGKVFIGSPASPNLNFLPILAPTLSKYSGKLPESYYLKAGGTRRNVKEIEISGENLGYSIEHGKGTLFQLAYLQLWKLALMDKNKYTVDFFEKLMDNLTEELTTEGLIISYSKKLPEGEDFILKFDKNIESKKTFFWDGEVLPLIVDSIVIKNPLPGLHHFKITSPSGRIEDSVLIVEKPGDRMGIDTLMLSSIADISGGGEWSSSLAMDNLQIKEREIWINLRHNWIFFSFLLLLLFYDWFLWMRRSG